MIRLACNQQTWFHGSLMQADDNNSDSFVNQYKGGKLLLRHIAKHELFAQKLQKWKQHAGAEATIGRELEEVHNNLLVLGQELVAMEGADVGFEKIDKELDAFLSIRADACNRLREGATLPCEKLLVHILRYKWKILQQWQPAEVMDDLILMQNMLKGIPDGEGLARAVSDRIAEVKEHSRKDALTSSLAMPLTSLESCQALLMSLKESATLPKTPEQIAGMRGVMVSACGVMSTAFVSHDGPVEQATSGTGLLTALAAERGVIGPEQANLKTSAETMSRLVDAARLWRSDVSAIQVLQSQGRLATIAQLSQALERKDRLKHITQQGAPQHMAGQDGIQDAYQDAIALLAHSHCCVFGFSAPLFTVAPVEVLDRTCSMQHVSLCKGRATDYDMHCKASLFYLPNFDR